VHEEVMGEKVMEMPVLVVYASKHGATQEIAERIAQTLAAAGQPAQARPVSAAADLAGNGAFVIGSAVYMGHWQKEAAEFVRRNRAVLAARPVWLFSSGPLGAEPTDAQGRDLTAAAGIYLPGWFARNLFAGRNIRRTAMCANAGHAGS